MFSIPFCRAQCKTFFGTVHALAAVQAPSKLPVRQSGFFGSENTKETIKTQYNVHQRPCKKTTTSDYCSMNHSKMSIDFNFFPFQNGTINTFNVRSGTAVAATQPKFRLLAGVLGRGRDFVRQGRGGGVVRVFHVGVGAVTA
jgi:hypothetical protein